ncbi:glycosyltransferase family 1 protein [Cytophagaceae bacterium BD1B2-1]|uniref:Glycosyltransferase family 1 protein n=2 Tax=Xanthocytophaga agilis TaxID=3048010 RepID=A0AAE3R026_9BACT|nr:glycosyltransferase family 1 protein [Xanthocytophaga agilis]MDJ1499137.1 glycosyltransferase family 1 protein [Xanthocytophaga agilis]
MHDYRLSASKKKEELRKLQVKIDQASYLTVISEFTLKEVKTHLTIGNIPVQVIHNGCNFSSQTVITIPSYIPPANFLFTIGTVVPKKNFHVLPAILTKNNLFLVIAGVNHDIDYKRKIEAEAKKWKVQDRVIFTGSISEEEKSWYYKHCTAFVFPSLAEGFGLPVIEAMYFGKPVFLSSLASLPEIGGNVANYFLNFDPQHMQEVLEKGLHENKSTTRSVEICQRACSFSWEKAAQKYRNIYQTFF